MSENENFQEEEIIWAKINKYEWWPSIILAKIIDINTNEYIYQILLFGNNIKRKISKNNISKFNDNYKQYSKTKNKELQNIIKKVKELYDLKDMDIKNKEIKEYISKIKYNEKENINESSSETSKTKERSGISTKKKIKKSEEKAENELIYKICNFLRHITACLVKKDTKYNFEKNKVYISKIFRYLKEYKIQEPIEFLKKTNLGKFIKYIMENIPNEELRDEANQVYKILENQVFVYLIKQK